MWNSLEEENKHCVQSSPSVEKDSSHFARPRQSVEERKEMNNSRVCECGWTPSLSFFLLSALVHSSFPPSFLHFDVLSAHEGMQGMCVCPSRRSPPPPPPNMKVIW